jgi:hypothetical protein
MNKTHRALVGVLLALLVLAGAVMWQNGELDAKAGVMLFAFVVLGVAILSPRAYDVFYIGLFLAICGPIYGLLSGRVMNVGGRRRPDVLLQTDEGGFWVAVAAWAAISLALCVLGIFRIQQHRRAVRDRGHDA